MPQRDQLQATSAENKRIADLVRERYQVRLGYAMRHPAGVVREMNLDDRVLNELGWILRATKPIRSA